MYNPSLGRFMQLDPIEFEGGGTNLYRTEANNPVTNLDPTGLQVFTVPAHNDYKGYSQEVHDVSAIVFDVVLSGFSEPAVNQRAHIPLKRLTGPLRFFDAMESYCKDKHGAGWAAVPSEFRLTGLKFRPVEGLAVGPPRRAKITFPVLVKREGKPPTLEKLESQGEVPLGHFLIEGYWVFTCSTGARGKTSSKYAIATEGNVSTGVHAPYDKTFAQERARIIQRLNSDKTVEWYAIGRAYDRDIASAGANAMSDIFDRSDNPLSYLRMAPGDKAIDATILKLPDIFKDFDWP